MMKVEMMSNPLLRCLQDDVNKFVADHNVMDIQFEMSKGSHDNAVYAVMIVYEE